MQNRLANLIAGAMLALMALFAISSVADDSATFDETIHIPAGYSYLTQKDMRLNPEHPPLIKDLAAIPLLFLNLNFPKDSIYWTLSINDSLPFSNQFLYFSNRNADQILLFARFPMILILIIFGFFLFKFTREMGGNKLGLMVLILYVFSPEFLANGGLVTTDVGATATIFISFYFFLKFLRAPSKKNIILAGLFLGIALLTKFSAVILIPFFAIILGVRICFFENKNKLKGAFRYCGFFVLAMLIAAILVGAIYQFHLWNFPIEKQINYTKASLNSFLMKPIGSHKILSNFSFWLAGSPILRPYGYYLLGLDMASIKTFWGFGSFGVPIYFLGKISTSGWWYYFPIVYLIKIPLAFHILSLLALWRLFKTIKTAGFKNLKNLIKENFTEFSMIMFLVMYFSVALTTNINLGLRHLLPIFPFLYILVCKATQKWLSFPPNPKTIIVIVLFVWYIFASVSVRPFYLTYFNELAGGPSAGSRYVVDSNLDWGQDLKRLKKWVDENNIEKIKIDYFGGGNVEYYFGEKYEKFDPKSGPQTGWLAISATPLRGGQGRPAPGFKDPTGYYNWLKDYEPVSVIGNSIFVYHIE